MSFVLANLNDGIPQYFTLDRKLSGGMGAACWQADKTIALQFARQTDADKFKESYCPQLSAMAMPA